MTRSSCHARGVRRGLAFVLLLSLGAWEPFRSPDPDVTEGNKAYAEGRYDDAIAAYDRAAKDGNVDAQGLAFDRGTALLKKAEATKDPAEKARLTERAMDDLKQGARSKDPNARKNALWTIEAAVESAGERGLGAALERKVRGLRREPVS